MDELALFIFEKKTYLDGLFFFVRIELHFPLIGHLNGDEAQSQGGGPLIKSSISIFLTVALKFKMFAATALEYLYDITGGDLFLRYCGSFSHVSSLWKMLLKLISSIPLSLSLSLKNCGSHCSSKQLAEMILIWIYKIIDMTLGLEQT